MIVDGDADDFWQTCSITSASWSLALSPRPDADRRRRRPAGIPVRAAIDVRVGVALAVVDEVVSVAA